jgi:translation initiation factor 1 (eIF-1/SUI1)
MISIAKQITVLMAKLNELMKDRKSNKKELITIAKDIAAESMEITRLAKELAANCTNKRMKLVS